MDLGIVSEEFVPVVEIISNYVTLSNVGHGPQISARHIELSYLPCIVSMATAASVIFSVTGFVLGSQLLIHIY
jgi:hypothetical protein